MATTAPATAIALLLFTTFCECRGLHADDSSIGSTSAFVAGCHRYSTQNFRRCQSHRLPLELSQSSTSDNVPKEGVRLNKVFKATHSRREADKLVEEGRVSVNGEVVRTKGGMLVVPYRDEVRLDGDLVENWERLVVIGKGGDDSHSSNKGDLGTSNFEYIKYFKPLGVTCTTDSRVKDNIIDSIRRDGLRSRTRIFPVGRLDKETTGLIILTSDGRLVNSVLRGDRKQPKVYKVMVNGRLSESDLQNLRDGIVIKTVAQRKGRTEEENTLVARTRPALIERLGPSSCQMTLVEGRNRQIRKMMEALGHQVVRLHRVEFIGMGLGGLERPGDWTRLDKDEMDLVKKALGAAADAAAGDVD
ncbi:hypothetical protein THAOC_27754 [Thalassiosira oceanica]|uniref:RNA-binding S4 domain-containing protein n=1 Tax=Thalassiosira oceanica TaxID=159749 RepID=K0RKU2_THAOC|nr:hypothetical protein THAOC_27754 [Thalassiosira oceanica]|eukprot:EJK52919.1 hypothetical protein THAOC_27754 [Thalassiosira oceanica]